MPNGEDPVPLLTAVQAAAAARTIVVVSSKTRWSDHKRAHTDDHHPRPVSAGYRAAWAIGTMTTMGARAARLVLARMARAKATSEQGVASRARRGRSPPDGQQQERGERVRDGLREERRAHDRPRNDDGERSRDRRLQAAQAHAASQQKRRRGHRHVEQSLQHTCQLQRRGRVEQPLHCRQLPDGQPLGPALVDAALRTGLGGNGRPRNG